LTAYNQIDHNFFLPEIDFLNQLYKNVIIKKETLYTEKYYTFYKKLAGTFDKELTFNYIKTDPMAPAPFKMRASDSGYDLSLMKKIKTHGNVEFYDTCIKVQPCYGYYFDLVGRSSISKSGYMLANNIGIIDRTYTGSIIVPLIKINPACDDIQLPCRLVQIIPRQIHHLEPIEVDTLNSSDRGNGGFGSTN
jgi:dUTP pyrophosphatase